LVKTTIAMAVVQLEFLRHYRTQWLRTLSLLALGATSARRPRLLAMFSPAKYLAFANQAQMDSELTTNPAMKRHYECMASEWRSLADFTALTEATRPGGPRTD